MTDEIVSDALLDLGECTITGLTIDVLRCAVIIHMLQERELVTEHVVRFEEVVSFFFAAGQGEDRFRLGLPTDELGWNMAAHYPGGAARIEPVSIADPWTELYRGIPNFAITLGGNGALMIEARRIIIDGHLFEVGYADSD
jgi:hypothetical protein